MSTELTPQPHPTTSQGMVQACPNATRPRSSQTKFSVLEREISSHPSPMGGILPPVQHFSRIHKAQTASTVCPPKQVKHSTSRGSNLGHICLHSMIFALGSMWSRISKPALSGTTYPQYSKVYAQLSVKHLFISLAIGLLLTTLHYAVSGPADIPFHRDPPLNQHRARYLEEPRALFPPILGNDTNSHRQRGDNPRNQHGIRLKPVSILRKCISS